jgi:hypothetical protein
VIGDGRHAESYGFDLSSSLVPAQDIVASGMPRDGLSALDDPALLTAAEVEYRNQEGRGKFLLASDRVIGVEVAGDARAYPLRFLRWHEVVNDTVAGAPVVITYNPLCDSVMVADRTVGSDVLTFGVSGLLFNSNLLLYDRRETANSASLWSQLQARAITGPAARDRLDLQLLPAAVTTWGEWQARHTGSRVLAPTARLEKLYRRDPYHSYFGSDLLRFPVDPLPPPSELALKDRVVAITVDEITETFALKRLASAVGADHGVWTTKVAGIQATIRFDSRLGTAVVAHAAVDGPAVGVRHAFWFAWYAQHPGAAGPLR